MASFSWTPGLGGSGGSSGANTFLSNLTGPTAINTTLAFAAGTDGLIQTADSSTTDTNNLTIKTGEQTSTSGARNSGSLTLYTAAVLSGSTGQSGNISIYTGDTGTLGSSPSGALEFFTGDTNSATGVSGHMLFETGGTNGGDSGSIILEIGDPGAGTAGTIQLHDGSQGTAFAIAQASDTNGSISWFSSINDATGNTSVDYLNRRLYTPNSAIMMAWSNTGLTLGATTSSAHTLNTTVAAAASGSLTLTNAPAGKSGNPAGYIQITINGTPRVIPFW